MLQKIKNKLNNFQTKLEKFNKGYIDYILCITFLNLIILKINQILFQIPSIHLYPIIIFISIVFINQWIFITNKIKNTYLFNWFFYYFLIFKNNLYGIIFDYFQFIEELKYQKLMIFLTGFVLSSWFLNIFFLIINHSYNISISFFILLLIINIFNLIEKKLIFTSENINQKISNLDYNFIKNLLKINNLKFNKNKPLFYIQKRYVHFNEIKNIIKKHGVTVVTSATAGSLFTGYLQHSSVKVQKEQLELQKTQFEYQKTHQKEQLEHQKVQFEHQRTKDKEDLIKWREDLNLEKIKIKQNVINATDEKIGILDKKIHKLKLDMDTRHFWNKIDFSETILNLKEEKELLKRRRSYFEEEMKKDKNIEISTEKKIKIDDNNFLND